MTMRCHECGGEYLRQCGSLEMFDEYIGRYVVDSVDYLKCDQCGDLLFSPEAALTVEKRRSEVLDEVLQSRPLNAFLTASEAASVLGVSRQALHKHRRIRRGFIFQTRFGGSTVYLRRSVELFKTTGDGRFPLRESIRAVEYVSRIREVEPAVSYAPPRSSAVFLEKLFAEPADQTSTRKDVCYVG